MMFFYVAIMGLYGQLQTLINSDKNIFMYSG